MVVSAGLQAGPTIALTETGRAIHVDPTDHRGRRLVEARGDLNPLSKVMWHHALRLRRWDVVVDAGANYGEMLVDAPLPEAARVIGFEPNGALHPYLTRSCGEAGVPLDLRGEAVSDRAGTASFAVDGQWSGTSTLLPGGDADPARWQHSDVRVTTLDLVLEGAGSWCAKVDVEGAELSVLAGAARAMDPARPWALMLEVLHVSPDDLARLAAAYPAYLLDRRTHDLVPVVGGHARLVRTMLRSGWLYPQDCLLLSPHLVRAGRP